MLGGRTGKVMRGREEEIDHFFNQFLHVVHIQQFVLSIMIFIIYIYIYIYIYDMNIITAL